MGRLVAKLKENLALCAEAGGHEPSVDTVHDVRTGTRRIEAVLDSMQSSMQADVPGTAGTSGEAIERWRRLLRRIRRSAGAVRDLDVHRGLLRDLLKEVATAEIAPGASAGAAAAGDASQNASPNVNLLRKQAEDLDAWLRHTRHEHSRPLVEGAAKWAAKLEDRFAALCEALAAPKAGRRIQRNPAMTALDAFARLSSEMEQLHAENLHDFRKGAKKARYMTETGGEDEFAGAVGKALKKLQDEIGDWHDWLVLAEEAHRALGDHGVELTAHIEREREQHYSLAMETSERMRGRLMGEWQAAVAPRRRVAARRSASLKTQS